MGAGHLRLLNFDLKVGFENSRRIFYILANLKITYCLNRIKYPQTMASPVNSVSNPRRFLKFAKYDYAMNDVISAIRKSHFGKSIDEDFLQSLKMLTESKMVAADVIKRPESIMDNVLLRFPHLGESIFEGSPDHFHLSNNHLSNYPLRQKPPLQKSTQPFSTTTKIHSAFFHHY